MDATYTGILKPDPRAYQLITAGLGWHRQTVCLWTISCAIFAGAAADMQTVHFNVTQAADSYRQVLRLLGIEEEAHD
ncbi:MAG: hypothetical protein R3E89_13440 [Thiolinea sp.]